MTNSQSTPVVKSLLHRDMDGEARHISWNYRSAVIGMMNSLQQSITRPDISFVVHQCAQFCNNPKRSHERAVKRIGNILCKPDKKFWNAMQMQILLAVGTEVTRRTQKNVMSCTGYMIRYAGCSIVWCSKLQTEVALSTTEAKYIVLSQSMREVIPIIYLMDELKPLIDFYNPTPEICCQVFEDNHSCIIVAESARLTPQTEHIAIKYHHFCQFVKKG